MIEIKQIIINLEDRTDKLFNCIKQIRKLKINDNIIISNACNVKDVKELMFDNISKKAYENIITKQDKIILDSYESVGRAISHKNVWKYIIDNKIENCFIIEDNLEVKNEKLFKFDISEIKRIINSKGDKPLFITFNSKFNNRETFYL